MSETLIPLAALLLRPIGGKKPLRADPNWHCRGKGDCCTKQEEVVMTQEEAAAVVHAAPSGVALKFRPLDGNFVALQAGPCPLYAFKTCLVYEARPYNCRRFMCMRPDPATEPYDEDVMKARILGDKKAQQQYRANQRKHSGWALTHGWKV